MIQKLEGDIPALPQRATIVGKGVIGAAASRIRRIMPCRFRESCDEAD